MNERRGQTRKEKMMTEFTRDKVEAVFIKKEKDDRIPHNKSPSKKSDQMEDNPINKGKDRKTIREVIKKI